MRIDAEERRMMDIRYGILKMLVMPISADEWLKIDADGTCEFVPADEFFEQWAVYKRRYKLIAGLRDPFFDRPRLDDTSSHPEPPDRSGDAP